MEIAEAVSVGGMGRRCVRPGLLGDPLVERIEVPSDYLSRLLHELLGVT